MKRYVKSSSPTDLRDKIRKNIEGLANKYPLISVEGDKWVFEAPEDADHTDCIHFVDDVVEAVNGQYYGTGRGGSWTAWDISAPGHTRLKAGWNGFEDNWFVEIIGVIPW